MGDESNIELKVINNILKIKDKAKEKICTRWRRYYRWFFSFGPKHQKIPKNI